MRPGGALRAALWRRLGGTFTNPARMIKLRERDSEFRCGLHDALANALMLKQHLTARRGDLDRPRKGDPRPAYDRTAAVCYTTFFARSAAISGAP